MKPHHLVLVVVVAVCGIWLAIDTLVRDKVGPLPVTFLTSSLRAERSMPDLDGAVEWLNSKPLTTAELRGKVVLVDFWTYSCINWHRTFPYVRAWANKYRAHGLVVIGVHTPEFGFEKEIDNVRTAASQLRIDYPIAVDSEHVIWRAFDNLYWPALYFVDSNGKIRHHQFGEGDYEQSERVIQQLLVEAGAKDVPPELVRADGAGIQADADWKNLHSQETYVGHDRAENFSSPGGLTLARERLYSPPEQLGLNKWALSGLWRVDREAAVLKRANGRILHRFHARDLHLVMGPSVRGRHVPFRLLIDGKPPGSDHGVDVDSDGRGVLVEHRLYQLIRQQPPVVDRVFEIEFLEPGVDAYSFTFG